MHLLRFRPHTTTERLHLPDGTSRLVKVTVNDAHDVQQIEDGDRLHGTAIPAPVEVRVNLPARQRRGMLLRGMGMPKIRQRFSPEIVPGLWAPLDGYEPREMR